MTSNPHCSEKLVFRNKIFLFLVPYQLCILKLPPSVCVSVKMNELKTTRQKYPLKNWKRSQKSTLDFMGIVMNVFLNLYKLTELHSQVNMFLNLYKLTELHSQVHCGIQGVLYTVSWSPCCTSLRTAL